MGWSGRALAPPAMEAVKGRKDKEPLCATAKSASNWQLSGHDLPQAGSGVCLFSVRYLLWKRTWGPTAKCRSRPYGTAANANLLLRLLPNGNGQLNSKTHHRLI